MTRDLFRQRLIFSSGCRGGFCAFGTPRYHRVIANKITRIRAGQYQEQRVRWHRWKQPRVTGSCSTPSRPEGFSTGKTREILWPLWSDGGSQCSFNSLSPSKLLLASALVQLVRTCCEATPIGALDSEMCCSVKQVSSCHSLKKKKKNPEIIS